MNDKTILKTLVGFAVAAALMLGTSCKDNAEEKAKDKVVEKAPEKSTKRPNILLIIGDDIGLDVTTDMYPGIVDNLLKQYGPSGHNNPKYKMIDGRPASTPVLDKLAKEGMRFSQAWAQPYCSPTRTSLISGLYSVKTGVFDYMGALSKKQHSFVRDLKEKGGYSTAAFGKWHIAGLGRYTGLMPKEAGFDLYLGNLNGGIQTYFDYDYHIQDDTTPPDKYRTEKPPVSSLPGIAPTTFAPVVKTANAINWITEQEKKNPDKPWFVWFAFNLSHITGKQVPNPMVIPNKDTMDEKSIKEMEECMGSDGQFGSANVGSCSPVALMRGMTNTMDTMTGRLIDTVNKLDPNTYIIYIGDNGTWMFTEKSKFIDNMYITREGRGKGTAFESGVRVSMAIRGPGIKPDSQCDDWIHTTDLFSTILDMAGLEIPKMVPNKEGNGMVDLDSVSLAPVLFKGTKELRDPDKGYLLAEVIDPVKGNRMEVAVRNKTYKIICDDKANTDSCTFYNLVDDPIEEYPLAKPDSCTSYQNGTWTPADPEWNYCQLQEIVAKKSFLANPPPKRKPMFGGPGPKPKPEN